MATAIFTQDKSHAALYASQSEANERLTRSLRPDNPTILVAPTGAGKTHMAADIAMDYKRVLFVANRREIISQAKAIMPSHVKCLTIHAALNHGPKEWPGSH
jgi:superfamily II DNA or RNA helicase